MIKFGENTINLNFDAATPFPGFETVKIEAERRVDGDNVHGKWEVVSEATKYKQSSPK